MKNLAAVFMGALVLAGCGSVRYPASYVLNFPPPARQPADSNGALSPIAVREFQCPEYLCEGRIVYRSSPEEVGFYEYHRWAMNPRQAITQYVGESSGPIALQERGGPRAWFGGGVYAERHIERLEEVDHGRDVRVVCRISAQLLETRTRSLSGVKRHRKRSVLRSGTWPASSAASRPPLGRQPIACLSQ